MLMHMGVCIMTSMTSKTVWDELTDFASRVAPHDAFELA